MQRPRQIADQSKRLQRESLTLAALILGLAAVPADAARPVDFNRDIRPILSDKCFHCHGPDSGTREADLRLDHEDAAKADRGGYAAVVPGKLDESELVRRILSEDESERMPPTESGKPLTAKEIGLLKQWVIDGAPWALAWSYQPPQRRQPPAVADKAWPKNWIDDYMLARWNSEGLAPAADADKTTLIRRLSIDLTGLPPTPEEVKAFLTDDGPEAHERLVDRLLSSPHYGERMAAYWLDLVRYADTVGYHGDQEHHATPYRDYVIDEFNANTPFDQFTQEQLAGDLLPQPKLKQKIATGYNRLLQTSHEGGVQAKEYMAIYAADHVRNVSLVWMGATLGCAQCHDHKYDPYTAKDFYSMAAFFADVDEVQHLTKGADRSPTIRAPEMELLTPDEEQRLAVLERRLKATRRELRLAKRGGDAKAVESLEARVAKDKEKVESLHTAARRTMITVAIEPRVTRILPRGNWMDDSGEIVEPAIPEFLGTLPVGARRATRLDLARWLTDSDAGVGGLTARVMANRFWYLLFGRGLSGSLDDFGGQGEPPDHPELLDALAVEFVESGWDVKHLLKLIAMSRAYRQVSSADVELRERDPLNRLFARQSSFRYPAESIRDASLAISGLLVPTVGGPSARPYQPSGYYRHLNFPAREYVADANDNQWRRGVYMHWQRQYLHPMLKAFDAPSREECTCQRPRSNTAPAALVLLNDPTFVEAARAFASRIMQQGGSTTAERLDFAMRLAASRSASTDDQQVLGDLLARSRTYYAEHPDEASKLLAIGLSPIAAGLDRVELASWTVVARATLNLHEVTTRN